MRELLSRVEIPSAGGAGHLSLYREDLSGVYPGMVRYLLLYEGWGRTLSLFSTNTYEYPPLLTVDAESAAWRAARDWEEALRSAPDRLVPAAQAVHHPPEPAAGGVLVLQGSPRPDGTCARLAMWAADAARSAGRAVEVVFVHDLEIHPCIGCYQCYNTGECTFDDDMTRLGPAIGGSSLLVVCSPVYTNTVPAGLKALIDRAQAVHAHAALLGEPVRGTRNGVLLAAAGRSGLKNFDCVRKVVGPFMENLGIRLTGEVLVDDLDRRRNVDFLPGLEGEVRRAVISSLPPAVIPGPQAPSS
ncbi:MAG TPA: flavodoxin family protein [Methanoregulaceae archaeon]|nr:flavodoxin family protein [Methanoregulaceae archaeon]HQJ87852.1 flavodoxin family protein [Methanoregulaceae archaeon]